MNRQAFGRLLSRHADGRYDGVSGVRPRCAGSVSPAHAFATVAAALAPTPVSPGWTGANVNYTFKTRPEGLAERMTDSYLFIQGPPGSGKTWTGARLVVSLIQGGARVGIAANSHKAIHNLLHETEAAAVERGVSFRGWKKCSVDNPETKFVSTLESPLVENEANGQSFPPPDDVSLVAGTAWLFAPAAMAGEMHRRATRENRIGLICETRPRSRHGCTTP